MDSDEETDDEEVSMIVEDPETKLKDIIVELEGKAAVGRKLVGARMMKLRVGVPMWGAVVKLTAKSVQKDKGMASQEIRPPSKKLSPNSPETTPVPSIWPSSAPLFPVPCCWPSDPPPPELLNI